MKFLKYLLKDYCLILNGIGSMWKSDSYEFANSVQLTVDSKKNFRVFSDIFHRWQNKYLKYLFKTTFLPGLSSSVEEWTKIIPSRVNIECCDEDCNVEKRLVDYNVPASWSSEAENFETDEFLHECLNSVKIRGVFTFTLRKGTIVGIVLAAT